MRSIFKNVLIGTLLTVTFPKEEAYASSPDKESTILLPITKEITKTIDGAKNAKDAWDKLCGKKFLKGGVLRSAKAMKIAKEQQYFATVVAGFCYNYPGFDSSTIAKIVKARLWGVKNVKQSFSKLIDIPIKATTVEFKKRDKDGVWHIVRHQGGVVRTVKEELIHYADFPMMTNIKYPVCMVKNPENLPANMKELKAHARCKPGEQVAVIKNSPDRPTQELPLETKPKTKTTLSHPSSKKIGTHRQGQKITTEENYINKVRPSLKDLDEGRSSFDDEHVEAFGQHHLNDALDDMDQGLQGASKQTFKGESLEQSASLIEEESTPQTSLSELKVHHSLKSQKTKEDLLNASKDLSRAMGAMTKSLEDDPSSEEEQDVTEEDEVNSLEEDDSLDELNDEVSKAEENLKAAEAKYNAHRTLANKQARNAASVALGKAKFAAAAAA